MNPFLSRLMGNGANSGYAYGPNGTMTNPRTRQLLGQSGFGENPNEMGSLPSGADYTPSASAAVGATTPVQGATNPANPAVSPAGNALRRLLGSQGSSTDGGNVFGSGLLSVLGGAARGYNQGGRSRW